MASITRDEAVATLDDGQAQLDALLSRLSDEELARPATIGGGDWSAKDLMGHIAHWNELALEGRDAWRRGGKPAIEESWDDIDAVNAANYERSRDASPDQARERMRRAHDALAEAIRAMSDAEWHSTAPYPTERRAWMGMMMGSITAAPKRAYGHAFAHLRDLEAYVSELHP